MVLNSNTESDPSISKKNDELGRLVLSLVKAVAESQSRGRQRAVDGVLESRRG
jgi:hypothetical protein